MTRELILMMPNQGAIGREQSEGSNRKGAIGLLSNPFNKLFFDSGEIEGRLLTIDMSIKTFYLDLHHRLDSNQKILTL